MASKVSAPLDELDMKARCIDYLLPRHSASEDYVLINELKFGEGKRRADIVELNGTINVFEIKSDLDGLTKLPQQLADYKYCFDTVTVVTTAKHLENVRRLVPKSVGLMLVEQNSTTHVRTATSYKRFNNFFLASLLTMKEVDALLKRLGMTGRSTLTATQKKLELSKLLAQNELRECAIDGLKKRYRKSFLEFLRNRGSSTLADDVQLLGNGSTCLQFRLESPAL